MTRDAHDPHPHDARIEPAPTDWSNVRFDAPPPHARAHARRGGFAGWRITAIAVLVAALLLLVLRQPLSDWLWPDTRAQQLRADAAQALAEGRLTAADGSGARELYQAALALDPDRVDARDGLARVGALALVQARDAIAQARHADAHASLALARELSVPRAESDAVATLLREREAASAGIDGLLMGGADARRAGRLDGAPDSALALYQRVLALQPTRTEALEGREDTLSDLLQLARQDLARGELAAGAAIVRRAQAVDAGHVELPETLAGLVRAGEQRRARADADLRRGRLPAAADGYRAVLAAQPDDEVAQRGLLRVGAAYARRSEQQAADFRFEAAAAALREAQVIAPDAAATEAARQRLQRARMAAARIGGPPPSAQRRRELDALLQRAAAAEARGDLLSPPGDSAYDTLRAARAIAPQDPRVRQASARLLPAARDCFDRDLRGNRLVRARECLDARRLLEGETAGWRDDRRRLAQRWVAVGVERLGAGEIAAARSAATSARALDDRAPGLDELDARLRSAASAADDR